jgi:uncharacterized protein involved in exopolysaccharide biosynthesis
MAGPDDLGGNPWESGADDLDESLALPAFVFDPLGVLRRRWIWMLAAVCVGMVATAFAVHRSKPTYVAQASVLLTSQQIPEDFVRSTVREDAISNINAMVGKVLSRENLSRLIDEYKLYAEAPPDMTMDEKVGQLRDSITVEPQSSWGTGRGQGSMIYVVQYRSKDPAGVAGVANALAGLFMEASIERRGELARLTTSFLSRELKRDEEELRAQSQKVSDFRREHRGELPSELDTNLRRLEMLSERNQALSNQIAAKENRIITLESMPQTTVKTQNETLLEELQRQLAQQSAVLTDEHPNVIALRERVARQSEAVEAERKAAGGSVVIAAERRDLDLLKNQVRENQKSIDDLSQRIDITPTVGEQLSVLEQKETVLRERYLDSLRKVEQAQLAENLESAQQGAQVSILDRAHRPTSPERPRWMLAAAGLVASLGLGVGVMILLELIDPVIVNTRQLERLNDGGCLGSLPLQA